MRKTGLTDKALCTAVSEMESGLIDADLGGGVVKKRVALPGCVFQTKPATDSRASLPPIPDESCH